MTSKPVAFLLADLGITRSHSRPQVSNDNSSSESQFKTLKYRPVFPDRFASVEEARAFCQTFFPWYNTEHHHSGLGLHPPEAMHCGLAAARQGVRAETLATAAATHPERFLRQPPSPPTIPTAAWLNKPAPSPDEEDTDMTYPALPSLPVVAVSTRLTGSGGGSGRVI